MVMYGVVNERGTKRCTKVAARCEVLKRKIARVNDVFFLMQPKATKTDAANTESDAGNGCNGCN